MLIMKKALFIFLFYYCSLAGYAQVDSLNVDSFMIVRPGNFQAGNNCLFLDNREADTLDLGYIIQKKYEGNFIFNIQPAYPLKEQFIYLLDSFNSATHSNRQLLLQLVQLKFGSEGTNNINQRRLMFRARLFEASEKGYCRLGSIDTVAAIDVKNNKRFILNCFHAAADVITGFISSCLSKPIPDSCEYITLTQISNIDSIQKSHMALYTTNTFTDGVYASYESFRDQVPDYIDFDAEMENSVPVRVRKLNADANGNDKFNKIYSVVNNGKAFIKNRFNYYLLEKRGHDFVFRTTMKTDKGIPILLGVLTVSTLTPIDNIINGITKRYEIEYEMKLDYIHGNFIPYKMIKK
jgi:hypothetical protein